MKSTPRSTVLLLTDFGERDPYVGIMKMVILKNFSRPIQFVDLSHQVPPQNLHVAARMIRCSRPYVPPGVVWLIVVDPGVGTSRRAVAFLTKDGSAGVAPDNGVLTPLKKEIIAASTLPPSPSASPTFHGRDIFAPAAAQLLSGAHPHDLGTPLDPHTLQILADLPLEISGPQIRGYVVDVDRFGNLITNIPGAILEGQSPRIRVGTVEIPLVRTYADVADGEVLALIGSCGELEISVRNGSAAQRLKADIGTVVWVWRSS